MNRKAIGTATIPRWLFVVHGQRADIVAMLEVS